jgi:hypothetical protein
MYRVGWWEKKFPAVEIMCSSIFFADQISKRKNHLISTLKCTGFRQLKQVVQQTFLLKILSRQDLAGTEINGGPSDVGCRRN